MTSSCRSAVSHPRSLPTALCRVSEMEYIFADGKYILIQDGEVVYSTPDIAVMYCRTTEDEIDGYLVAHGGRGFIHEQMEDLKEYTSDEHHQAYVRRLTIVEGPFEIEDLNKFLHISGYIGAYCRRKAKVAADAAILQIMSSCS